MPDQRSIMNTHENVNTVPLPPPELPELSDAAQTLIPTANTHRCASRSRKHRQM